MEVGSMLKPQDQMDASHRSYSEPTDVHYSRPVKHFSQRNNPQWVWVRAPVQFIYMHFVHQDEDDSWFITRPGEFSSSLVPFWNWNSSRYRSVHASCHKEGSSSWSGYMSRWTEPPLQPRVLINRLSYTRMQVNVN